MVSLLADDVAETGSMTVSATDFADGEQMPDYVGYVNENENPELTISDVPAEAASLVLVMDDPDAAPVVGFTFDHWVTWDIDPTIGTIPRGWNPSGDTATVGYNDFVETAYSGPSPPDDTHGYRFKLVALDSTLDLPPGARKAVVDMTIAMEAEVLASTQVVGLYDPAQGTAF